MTDIAALLLRYYYTTTQPVESKDGSTPLLDTLQQHQETLKKSTSRPQHTRATSAVVQNSMPAGLVSAQMPPGIHDRPRSRSGAVLGV